MPPSPHFEAGAPVKQPTIQQSTTGTVRPTISLATLEILPIGRTRANCRGCIPCAFCDLPTNGQPIPNFLTDLRGAHAAFGPVRNARGHGRCWRTVAAEEDHDRGYRLSTALSGRGFALSRGLLYPRELACPARTLRSTDRRGSTVRPSGCCRSAVMA
jgi:hypothetical protein